MKMRVRPLDAVLGLIVLGLGAAIYALYLPLREERFKASCQSNLKQVGLGTMQYARDYDEMFMLASNARDALRPYMGFARRPPNSYVYFFECPKTARGYTYNIHLNGNFFKLVEEPVTMTLFFETSDGRNADDGRGWMREGVHRGGTNVLFADGHVKWLQLKPLFWTPELANKARVAAETATRWKNQAAQEKRRRDWIVQHQKKQQKR